MKLACYLRLFLIAVLTAAAGGCATLPSPDAMKSEVAGFQLPKQPESGKGLVYVVRPSQLGAIVRFNVFLDDQEDRSEMGFNRGGQYIYFNALPGAHKVFSKAENWAEISITVKAGEVVFIQQEPAMGIIMARNELVALDELNGKYWLKNSALGTILKTDR